MTKILIGALLGFLIALCPALLLAVASNPLTIAFAVGFAIRPAIARTVRGWAT